MMPFVWTYWPVSSAARLGEQSGVVANAFRNRVPSRASRSDGRRLDERVAGEAEVVPARVVNEDDDDVRPWRLCGIGSRAARHETDDDGEKSGKSKTGRRPRRPSSVEAHS